jgi:mannosyl-oligosaccharide glucosidase
MAGYGWEEYDVRTGGRQVIHDAGNNIDLTIDFIKFPGGNRGGSWGARIRGQPREDAPVPLLTTVVFYAAMEGLGHLDIANEHDPLGYRDSVIIDGQSPELDDFSIKITNGPGTNKHPASPHESFIDKPLDRTLVSSFQVPDEALWQTKCE